MTGTEWADKHASSYIWHDEYSCEDSYDLSGCGRDAYEAGKYDAIKEAKEIILKMTKDGKCAREIFETLCGDKLINDGDNIYVDYHWENEKD